MTELPVCKLCKSAPFPIDEHRMIVHPRNWCPLSLKEMRPEQWNLLMGGWLPIESAPKDGVTQIDLWFPISGRRTNWRWYRKNKFWGSVSGRFDRIDKCDDLPTHWQPLPQAPEKEQGDE